MTMMITQNAAPTTEAMIMFMIPVGRPLSELLPLLPSLSPLSRKHKMEVQVLAIYIMLKLGKLPMESESISLIIM